LAKNQDVTEANVKKLHRLFYYRIDAKQAGKYRKRRVIITGTDFIPPAPERIPEMMKAFVDRIPDQRAAYHPIQFAAIIHEELVTIHPFIDGNGRAARLLMNLALLQAGYPSGDHPPDPSGGLPGHLGSDTQGRCRAVHQFHRQGVLRDGKRISEAFGGLRKNRNRG